MAKKIEKHQVSAGNQLNGATPSGPPDEVGNKKTFPSQAGGGKFDFGACTIEMINMELDGVATWKLEHVNASDELIKEIAKNSEVWDEEQETLVPAPSASQQISCKVPLADGEKLKLTTYDATGDIAAEIYYDDGL